MLIAQISDTHLLAPDDREPVSGTYERRRGALRAAVRALAALRPHPDVVVHTGDVTHMASEAAYDLAWSMLGEVGVPILPVLGNRDDRRAMRGALARLPQPTGAPQLTLQADGDFLQYTWEHPCCRIVVVDTQFVGAGLGGFCRARAKYLAAALAVKPGAATVVALHHPPVPVPALDEPLQWRQPEGAATITRLVAEAPDVLGVLAGHTHRADRLELAGRPVMTPTCVAPDLRAGPHRPSHAREVMIGLHRVGPNGMTTQVIEVPIG